MYPDYRAGHELFYIHQDQDESNLVSKNIYLSDKLECIISRTSANAEKSDLD
jgi:hypothetical protein